MTPEQRGGKKDCYGCKDQLMINNAILENCKKRKKNLSTAWIDYKKAFDSVSHSWILKCLQMYKIQPVLITFIEESMSQWKTNMALVHKEGVLETGPIRIKRGIFQKKAIEKMSKYVDLQIECQRIWNKKVEVIPAMIGANGIVEKNIKKCVGNTPGCYNIYGLQRSAALGTAHILRKVLSIKPD